MVICIIHNFELYITYEAKSSDWPIIVSIEIIWAADKMMTVNDNRGTTTDHLGGSVFPAVKKKTGRRSSIVSLISTMC